MNYGRTDLCIYCRNIFTVFNQCLRKRSKKPIMVAPHNDYGTISDFNVEGNLLFDPKLFIKMKSLI